MIQKEQLIQAIHAWLSRNEILVRRASSMDVVVRQLLLSVLGASFLPDEELRAVIARWCASNMIFNPLIKIDPGVSEADMKKAARGSLQTAVGEPTVERNGSGLKIGISGVTAQLRKGKFGGTLSGSWFGKAGLELNAGDWKLAGEVATDKWEVKLTFPDDPAAPSLAGMQETFAKAEEALWGVTKSVSGFTSPKDIPRIRSQMEPLVDKLKDAAETIEGASKKPAQGISVGLKIGSPKPQPGETGMPPGYEASVTVTIWF